MAYIPYIQRKKKAEEGSVAASESGYVPFSLHTQQPNRQSMIPANMSTPNGPAYAPPPTLSVPKKDPDATVFGMKFDTMADGYKFETKTSTPMVTDYGTVDALQDLFYRKQIEVRNLFGTQEETSQIGGILPAGAVALTSRIIEATPRIALATIANYQAALSRGKDREINTGFDITRLGFEVPEGYERDVLADTGTRMVEDFERRMVNNPGKAKTNIALSVLNTALLDAFDAAGIGGITETAARQVLKSTQYNPALRGSLQQLGLEGKEVSIDTVREQFVTRAENIIKAGGGEKELNELGRATNEIMTALNGSGVPQLNTMGRILEDSSVFVLQDISKGIQYGSPRLRPLGESPVPESARTLPGYRREPGQAPAFGLSTERVEPVGFGDQPKKKAEPIIEDDKTLIGVHNLSEENLKAADDLGGLARPSLAVIDSNKTDFDGFGDITLVAPKELVDPRSGVGKTFAADVYSPRFPQRVLQADMKVADQLTIESEAAIKRAIGDADINVYRNFEDDPRRAIENDPGTSLRFLESLNIKPKKVKPTERGNIYKSELMETLENQISSLGLTKKYKEYVDELYESLNVKTKLYAGRTNTGRPRLRDNTLDDALAIMKKAVRDAEGFNYGLGSVRSNLAPQFRSLREIKANKSKIVTSAEFEKIRDEMQQQFFDLSDRLVEVKKYKELDDLQNLADYIAGKDRGFFLENYNIDDQLKVDIAQFRENLRKMPTEYFETKVKGALGLNRFTKAVVPDNASEKTLEILKKNGIEPVFYKHGDKADRKAKIAEIAKGNTGESFAGMVSGVEEDEDGNIEIDPLKLTMGFLMGSMIRKGSKEIKKLVSESDVVPKTAYHGTNRKATAQIILNGFKSFDGTWGEGIYLGKDKEIVQKYYTDKFKDGDGVLIEVETNVENPLILDRKYTGLFDLAEDSPELQRMIKDSVPGTDQINLVKWAKKNGYDSIFAKDVNELVVFDDKQITKVTIDGKVIRDRAPQEEPTAEEAVFDDFGDPAAVSTYEEMIEMLPGETEDIARLRTQLEQKALEIELFREALENMPASGLAPYVARRGEFKGGLPEVVGLTLQEEAAGKTLGRFARKGDDIITELGFDDTEEAREAWLEFAEQKKRYNEVVSDFRDLKKTMQALKYAEKEKDVFLKEIQKEITERLNKKIYSRFQMKDRVKAATEAGVEKGVQVGRKIGYAEAKKQITNRLRNTFGIQLDKVKRSAQLDALRTRIIERNRDLLRSDLTDYVKDNLPVSERGKFISMLKNADTQRKLVKAYSRVDAAVEEIRRKEIITEIQKKVKRLSESPSIAVDYREQISDIVSDLTFKRPSKNTIERLRKVREVMEKQKAAGQDVTIPERLIKQMEVLSKKNVTNQRTADLINLSDTIDLLAQLGKTKQATRERLYIAEKERRLAQLVADVKPLDKHPLLENRPGQRLTMSQRFRNIFPSILNAAQHVDLSLAPMDVFFDFLGGAKGTYQSAPSRIFKATTDANYGSYLDQKDPIINRIWEKAEELGLDRTNFERIGIHAARVQKDGREKLLNTGITEAEIDELELTPAEMELYTAMRSELEAMRPQIEEIMRTVYNRDLGQVENYFSFMTDFDAMSETEVFQRLGGNEMQEFGYATKNVEQGFTQSRTGAGKQKIKIDAMEVFTKHIDNAAYLVNMARDNRMLFEIANSPEFGAVAGDLGQRMTLEWLDTISRKGGKAGDEKIAFLDTMRRNIGVAYLGLKLSSAIIQPTALLDGASEIGTWAFKGAAEIGKSRGARKFVLEHFPEIRARVGDDPAYLDMGKNETINRIRDAGYYVLKKLDGYTASSVGWGAYLQRAKQLGYNVRIVENGDDDYMTIFARNNGTILDEGEAAKIHKDALEYAQRVVRNTQSSSFFKDAPRAITRGAFSGNRSVDRALFQFQTFVLRRWYRIRHDFYNAGIKEKDPKKIFNTLFYLSLAFLAEEGLRRAASELTDLVTGDNSTEEKDGYTASVAKNVLSTVPFMSQAMSMAIFRSDPVPALGAVRSIVTGAQQAITGAKDETKLKGLIELSEGVAAAFGIPGAAQASQLGKGFVDGSEGGALEDVDVDLDIDLDLDDIDLDVDIDI